MPNKKQILSSIPKGRNKIWNVIIDGEDKTDEVDHILLESDNYGNVEFGHCNNSYPGIIISENNGGGVVFVPYVRIKKRFYIGIIKQKRYNMHGQYSMAAGFIDEGETSVIAAKREAEEELGKNLSERLFRLNTYGISANRAHYFTPNAEDGLSFYGIKINKEELVKDGLIYRLKDNLFDPSDTISEKITDCIFVPIQIAVKYMQDDFAHIAASLLLCNLATPNYRPNIEEEYKKIFMD